MKRSYLVLTVWTVLLAAVLLPGLWSAPASSQADVPVLSPVPSTQVPSPDSQPAPAESAGPRAKVIKQLIDGKFQEGLAAIEANPALKADPLSARARTLTSEYLSGRGSMDQERNGDLAAAVARVKLARIAEKSRPKRADPKQDDPLFKHIEAMAEAGNGVDRLVSVNPSSAPADLLPVVNQKLDKALAELAAAEKLVASQDGEWGKAFQAAAAAYRQALEKNRQTWSTAKLPEGWRTLKAAAERAQDRLIDLGVLASRDPLLSALSHAREAKELSPSAGEFLKQDWVKGLIRDAEARGETLLKESKWGEALTLYGHGGLTDLGPNTADYETKVKMIAQHVRVINIFGRENGKKAPDGLSPSTLPTTKPGEEDPLAALAEEPRWQEMIVGVDTVMVRNAISLIDESYVDKPDYRKMAGGGLSALKTLALTKEAAKALPALKDEAKKAAFVAGVDKQLEFIRNQRTVDHLDLTNELNRLLDLNAQTINLPVEIVDMEFADGMMADLDQFSSIIWPYEDEDFRIRMQGSFVGVGVQIEKAPGEYIQVVTPLPDTPAVRAGIRAGDYLMKVDGKDTKDMSIERAKDLIRGPVGTIVTLTIRSGAAAPRNIEVKREEIHIHTVKGWRRMPDGKWDYFVDPADRVAYIRVSQFTQDTIDELRAALSAISQQGGAAGIILDVRFNPGGLLNSAVDLSDEFLARGLIVSTKGRAVQESFRDATKRGNYQDGKIIVLINRFSASASEILAGALKDWHRATIVGERTYGKGSVQQVIPLRPKKARLKLTTAYYYLPSGRCLHRVPGAEDWGVDPDVAVPTTVRQMNRWSEIRQETDLLKEIEPELLTKTLNEQLREDLQLNTALLLLRLDLLEKAPTAVVAKE